MTVKTCPVCNKLIPDYRVDDPYCDCGWQLTRASLDFDEIGIFTIIAWAAGVSVIQVIILVIAHFLGSILASISGYILYDFLSPETILFLQYMSLATVDLILLSILYGGVTYYLGKKSPNPVFLAGIIGFIGVGFKVFVVDPRSIMMYPILGYIMNFLLLSITIASGVVANNRRKQKAK